MKKIVTAFFSEIRKRQNLLLKMKLTFLALFLSLMQLSASVYSQATKFSFELKQKQVAEILREIESESNFRFFYQREQVDVERVITLNAKNNSVEEILTAMFKDEGIKFKVLDNDLILLSPETKNFSELIDDATMQQNSITGKVTDESGQPLPGVTVVVKGTTTGTVTDMDGNYTIAGIPDNATLLFSFVGMKSQEVVVGNQTSINITMVVDAIGLEEVVAIGYATVKKSDLTGSVASIKMEDVPTVGNLNLSQALRGITAGLNINGGSSAGSEPSMSIRGKTSLSASDYPLIVLDGIIFNGSISDINIDDVERIEVLKDASAAAVYGSRSANGVLLITTKKGRSGKPRLSFNSYIGAQDITSNPVKMMNAEQYGIKQVDYNYLQKLYGWYAKHPTGPNDLGGKPVRPDVNDPDVVTSVLRSQDEINNYLEGNEIDWIDEVTRVALMQNYNLNISGGADRYHYYMSGSYTDQDGVMINDSFKRITLSTKVDAKITNWFTLGLNTSFSTRDYSGLATTMEYAKNASPLASMYDENGNYPLTFNTEVLMSHPLRNTLVDNEDIRKNIFATVYAKIDIPMVDGLKYEFNYSTNNYIRNYNNFLPNTVYEGAQSNGLATISNYETKSWIFNNIINYSHVFSDSHNVGGTLLYSREQRNGQSSSISARQFENQSLGYNNVAMAELSSVGSGAWDENSISYMIRLNYTYKSKYLLTGTVRKDGFSGFGANNKYATFSSLSTAWVASNETFMQNTKDWLDLLKLRLSYGENGNQGIGRYSSLARMGLNTYVSGTSPIIGIYPRTLGNDDLGWEKTTSFNIGVDYAILSRRVSGSFELYSAQTSDVLVTRSLPGSTGYRSVWTNIGQVDNKGIEAELSTVNIESELRWESRFVFSLNRDKISKLYGDGKDDIGNSWFIGEPISAIYDYKRTGGVWTEQELYEGKTLQGFYPGQFRLKDFNDDGNIDANNDRVIVGYATPNYRFSIGNDFYYKNFKLSFILNSIQGGNGYYIQNNKVFLETTSAFDYAARTNQPAIRENWLPDNGVNDAPAVYNYPRIQSGNYQDRSFVRLQDMSLTYRFDKEKIKLAKIEGLQLSLSGKNLYTWTKWDGYDPEIGGATLPLMRSFSLGIKVDL